MLLNDAVDAVRSTIQRATSVRPHRRVWHAPGRVHIEVRGAHRPGNDEFVAALRSALHRIEGVHWAEVNAAVGRVIVAFDEDAIDVDELIRAVDETEAAFGLGPLDALDSKAHPADVGATRLAALEIGADIAGVALGVAARATRLPMLPIEAAATATAIDTVPSVRRLLDRRRDVEAAVVSTSALLQGLARGPVGLVVDATHRTLLLREAVARRGAWERVEPSLHATAEHARATPFERTGRPAPIPDGPLEKYARRIGFVSAGAGLGAWVLTRDVRKGADVLLAAVPRAGRLGRESFCAHADCILAGRDIVVMEPEALRRLDRVDTVIVDQKLLDGESRGAAELESAIHDAQHQFVVGGSDLVHDVRTLQSDGSVVALVSSSSPEALFAADCGIGVLAGALPPWGAGFLCPTLFDAALVIDASARARVASRYAVRVSIAGSAIASMLALGPAPFAARRTVLAMNGAALTAIAAGVWSACGLSGKRPVIDDSPMPPWHSLPTNDVMASLGTTESGLPAAEAAGRVPPHTEARTPTLPALWVAELANPLSAVLGAGGVVSTVTGSITDGLLITGVLGVNAFVGAAQRLHTEQAISRLTASVTKRSARVRRDASEHDLPPNELVDGDVILLQAGDVVPADARVFSATAIEVDESALTGESLPVVKAENAVDTDMPVAERTSMVYSGTSIAAGRAEAVVVATGDRTEAERGATHEAAPATGVEARLEALTRKTVPLVLAAGGVLTATTLLRGAGVREAVSTGVSLAAAAVPEGLPFLATVAQSAAARRLSAQGVLVRNPRVLEALGRADVLCFDKTGTLTEGELQLRSVSDGETTDEIPNVREPRRLVLAAALRATPRPRGHRLPHPTDRAVVAAAEAVDVRPDVGDPAWHKLASLPFSSTRGYHAVLGRGDDGPLLSVKGAPEVVLPRCVAWRRGDRVVALDDRARRDLERRVERFARSGLRVLAVAERGASGRADLDDERVARLELLGFITVADVTRSSATVPIANLQRAGIGVVMLTGDHPHTATAIATELGLLDGSVMTGTEIDLCDDDELERSLEKTTVFARVTPAHKVRIVQAYQRRGRVVAMTGDGANDAQAIRLADVGIAFGPRATPAARAAADLVIVDDRIETLVESIVEGRAMWASVRDALGLLLGGNLGEVLFTTGTTLVTGRSPLNPRQLLAVNLFTDLAPAIAIALQRRHVREIDLQREGPETSLGARLTRDIAIRAGATAAAATGAYTVARFSGTETRARTVALAALVDAQLGQTLVTGWRSPLVVASSLVSVGALATIVETPGLSQFFGCRPLGPVGWGIAGASAAAATAGAAVAGAVVAIRDSSASIS